jgi:hypothetical protein
VKVWGKQSVLRLPEGTERPGVIQPPWEFNIEDLLRSTNPNLKRYRDIALAATFYRTESAYSLEVPEYLRGMRRYEEVVTALSRDLVFDLGAGARFSSPILTMLGGFRVRHYVGSDLRENFIADEAESDRLYGLRRATFPSEFVPETPSLLPRDARRAGSWARIAPGLAIDYVRADILDLVGRLPDACGSFMINGIDTAVIDSPEYHRALCNELVRATRPGGLVFGMNSEVFNLLKNRKDKFELVDHQPPNGYVFRRRFDAGSTTA